MKASEIIVLLQNLIHTHGDMEMDMPQDVGAGHVSVRGVYVDDWTNPEEPVCVPWGDR